MRVAAAAYPLDWHDDWSSYEAKITAWVARAAEQGADLLVFPEYGAMELASLGGTDIAGDLAASLDLVAGMLSKIDALHARLARMHGAVILAASAPVREGDTFVNRARLFTPDGSAHQDKQIMTRFEREVWGISPGGPLTVFDTALGRIGVLICYDSEFPLLARALIEAGVEILLVPSCTDTLAGFTRVRVSSQARALEGQCVVIQSPTVGAAPWCPAVDENVGAAAIFGPPDRWFPDTGILAEGTLNTPGWTYADLSDHAVRQVRADGQVLNMTHWPEQAARLSPVKTVALTRE
ncbi:carbon-nitrogen hydrolase family protein [Anianabacter salinae]|uniref:carbon-nitrogen hydrolase family protein n=1 Tax=Anianabacter salinae TaxID=2851023 RepID=UPI00225E6D89|nr:carbon-nitrogen hydrolase family protein [Anianabacter salinae]MBV0912526.1 carbon-nitrogen hydrolase family protein [Anianabacter salinae]